jgi:hypothetical protein
MSDEHFPLGYLVSNEVLQNYAKTLTSQPMSDRHARAYAQFMTLNNAKATDSDAHWATSDLHDGIPEVRFLQISGGGPNEWRIPKDVEDRLCAELGLTGNPVRFKPENFGIPV